MHYIILGCVVIVGVIIVVISYKCTPDHPQSELSSKLVNTDISLESAIEELELIDIVSEDNNTSNTTVKDITK